MSTYPASEDLFSISERTCHRRTALRTRGHLQLKIKSDANSRFTRSSSNFGIQVPRCHVMKLNTEISWGLRYLTRREMVR